MRSFFVETKFIALKSMLISFLLHILIFSLFIFTFKVRLSDPGPLFIF